ncbi:hypothetical protein [Pleomorphovibrio marinus]|uniref:hypothetical protein n=1 Tax=Pleomorphovibrio marinus TaxID=2164132 RepID=UPI000E0A6F9C|nr:hypothetical protein [Pleomorphovibrio marinus]
MDQIELHKQSQELEQTLQKQMELLKKDSDVYLKVAGAALAAGILGYGFVKLTGKSAPEKPKKKKKKKKKKGKKGFSIWGNIRERLFWVIMDFLKKRFLAYMSMKMQSGGEKEK